MIFVNTRCLSSATTGVQRYTHEILRYLGEHVQTITPPVPLCGAKGHLWEQSILPLITRKGLLWSPCNTGPLAVKRQVVTIHDLSVLEHPEWFTSNFAKWYQFLLPNLVKRAHKILTVSNFSRNRIVEICQVNSCRPSKHRGRTNKLTIKTSKTAR